MLLRGAWAWVGAVGGLGPQHCWQLLLHGSQSAAGCRRGCCRCPPLLRPVHAFRQLLRHRQRARADHVLAIRDADEHWGRRRQGLGGGGTRCPCGACCSSACGRQTKLHRQGPDRARRAVLGGRGCSRRARSRPRRMAMACGVRTPGSRLGHSQQPLNVGPLPVLPAATDAAGSAGISLQSASGAGSREVQIGGSIARAGLQQRPNSSLATDRAQHVDACRLVACCCRCCATPLRALHDGAFCVKTHGQRLPYTSRSDLRGQRGAIAAPLALATSFGATARTSITPPRDRRCGGRPRSPPPPPLGWPRGACTSFARRVPTRGTS